jgi:hypothetical protein
MTTLKPIRNQPGVDPRIGMLMLFVAATLAIASALHLSGNVHGREPFDAQHAGIAEAVIGFVLACGAVAVLRALVRARRIGLGATGFAIVGFLVGLNFTTRGGDVPDVAYHIISLPILIVTFTFLARAGKREVDEEQLTR